MGAAEGIKHVVVLMLENRSFDSMFGRLYPDRQCFAGLSLHERNPYHCPDGTIDEYKVVKDDAIIPASICIPAVDPGEIFHKDMNVQIFGLGVKPSSDVPKMNGFVDNYMQQPGKCDAFHVMHYFTPEQVPVISQLAKAFGVSDQWYASAPCQTWPNRFFVHCATSHGYADNSPHDLPFTAPTIFGRLRGKGKSWGIYYHDLPQTATLEDIWRDAPTHFHSFEHFVSHAQKGTLPNYSFIEPRYFCDHLNGLIPNDEHPPHNMLYGEQLIASVYNAVRSAPTWKETLLIITFDEHGGCFDHMPPPLAVPPDEKVSSDGFKFDRYGVRVPTVVISPYMPPGEIIQSDPSGIKHTGGPYPYDHTSIIKTLCSLFDLEPLTERDKSAPNILDALTLNQPTNDGPASISTIVADNKQTQEELNRLATKPLSGFQADMDIMLAHRQNTTEVPNTKVPVDRANVFKSVLNEGIGSKSIER